MERRRKGRLFSGTVLILLPVSTVFIRAYLTHRLVSPEPFSASGACDRRRAHACRQVRASSLGRDGGREKTFTPTMRETSVCLERWARLLLYAFVWAYGGERQRERGAFPYGRLSLGIASTEKLSILLLIRRELSLYFSPSHPPRKLQENSSLFQHKFRSVSPHTNTLISAYTYCKLIQTPHHLAHHQTPCVYRCLFSSICSLEWRCVTLQ